MVPIAPELNFPRTFAATVRHCFFFLLFVAACTPAAPSSEDDRPRDGSDSYFSIHAFIRDQWALHSGQPYTIDRILTLNGERDSSVIQALATDWAALAKPFFEADISARKYLDRYQFSEFDENTSGSHVYSYDAKEPDLPTRLLLISTDPFNGRVRNLYVEHKKGGFWSSREQKLYYEPGRYISIQEWSHSRLGPDKTLHAEYRFLR